MRFLKTIVLILILIPAVSTAEISVTARFNPPRIALGDRAQYIVEVVETSTTGQPVSQPVNSLPIPDTHGLTLRNGRISTGQQTRIVNGSAEYSVTQSLIIDAAPPKVGQFEIPAYSLEYKGLTLQVPAASLQVLERSADAGPTRDELIFLKADLPEEIYLGQTLALELKLYIEESVRLSDLNAFDRKADGFTISDLPEKPSEDVEIFKGRRYRTLTWPLTLTPIQAGEQDIGFEFGLTARLPGQGSRDNMRRSPFGGSLFEDFFGRTERINVFTDSSTIDVLPLPEADRPRNFSGAIGDFAIEVASDSQSAVEGEPIMLSVVLRGTGNFERISGPGFPESGDWKYYEPEKKLETADALGLRGKLRFDYVFIPQRSGNLNLPETRFSFFNPEKKEYAELVAPPIPVEVEAAPRNLTAPPGIPPVDERQRDLKLSRSLTSEEALLTLDYRPKPGQPVGFAILGEPLFLGANIATALAIAGFALALRRRRRNLEDPSYPICAAARKSLEEAITAYKRALQDGDAEAFYKHGQAAVRHAATLRTRRSMQSADSQEIADLLSGPAAEDCRTFFAAANAHRFGGQEQQTLADSTAQVERILHAP